VLGLIVILGAQQVSITSLGFKLPKVPVQTARESFAALAEADTTNANRTILEAFANALEVAIGISAADAANLRIENCAFEVQVQGGGADTNLFSAAVLAGGQMTGLQLTGCTFTGLSLDIVPFYDLAAGRAPAGSNQLILGYLQMASGQAGSQSVLHDAAIEDCLFQGITVPALAVDRLGDLRLQDNTVRDCYGGFWLWALAESADVLAFDVVPVGNAGLRSDFEALGVTALGDVIPLIASAMVRVLPQKPPTDSTWTAGVIEPASQETIARVATGVRAFFNQIPAAPATAGQGPSSPPSSASSPPSSAEGSAQAQVGAIPALDTLLSSLGTAEQAVPLATDTGVNIALRLDMSGCQVDAVLAESYSGAALIVADRSTTLGATPGSALIRGNRLRNRFPNGQTALVVGMGDVAITGNVMANEILEQRIRGTTYSLVLLAEATNLTPRPVAVVGNVFVDSLSVPGPGLPWETLNTITFYL
jgi:hypothetical protein